MGESQNCNLNRRDLFRLTGLGIGASVATSLGGLFPGIAHAKGGAWLKPLNQTGVPRSFKQGVPKYTSKSVPSSGGINLGKQGCAVFSALNLYLKSGARDTNYAIEDIVAENDKAMCITNSGGLMTWGSVGAISKKKDSKGYFEFVKTARGSASDVKKYFNDGYMAILGVIGSAGTVDSHWVALDYVSDDGKIVIIDSGWGSEYLSDPQFHNQIGRIQLYQAYDMNGKKVAAKDLPKTSEWTKPGEGGGGSSGGDDDKDKKDSGGSRSYTRITEEDLEGMESYKKQKEWADKFEKQTQAIKEPPPLTDEESYNLETLRDNIDSSKKSPTDWANQGIVFTSLLGMMYSILLFFA